MKKIKQLLIALILSLSLALPSTAPVIGTIQTVSAATQISNKNITLIKGQTKILKITGTSKIAKWKSSNKTVATVTQQGKVTAKKKGSSIITATVGKSKFTFKVTVQTPAISKTSITVLKGKQCQLKLNGTNQKISWKSSNTGIATVSSSGLVSGKATGTCTIYATVLGKKYSCKVTVKSPEQQVAMVWLSATGEKYHKIPNCGRMNPANARKITLSEALSLGYTACQKCF